MRRWDYCLVEKLGSRKSKKTGFDQRIRASEPELKPRCGLKALSLVTGLLPGEGPAYVSDLETTASYWIKHWATERHPGQRGLQSDGKPDWLLPEPAPPLSPGEAMRSVLISQQTASEE